MKPSHKKSSHTKSSQYFVICFMLLVFSSSSLAFYSTTQEIEFKASGFLSVVAGKVLSGEIGQHLENTGGYDCPCFVGDYPGVGVYEDKGWDFAPDSRAGIQFDTKFSDAFQFATQIVGRGGDDMKPELSAFFLTYKQTEHLSFDVGRQRLPLFYYSDFYDVGYAYPWIRVPADLYAWPINSYNGVSATYTNDLGDGTFVVRAWAGEEKESDNRYYEKIYYGSEYFVTHWKNIVGGSFSYFYEWLDLRAVFVTNDVYNEADYGSVDDNLEVCPESNGINCVDYDHARQEFVGLAAHIDYENILIKTEYNQFDIFKGDFESDAKLISLGYRFGNLTPTLSYTRYNDFDPSFGLSEFRLRSAGLRWDFRESMDFKIQYDVVTDRAVWPDYYAEEQPAFENFVGDTKTLSMGVDYVF